MLNKLRAQHYILFLAAAAGAVWFFIGYPSQDVRSAVDLKLTQKQIKATAEKQLEALGFSQSKFKLSDASFLPNDSLLDSLQAAIGRPEAIQVIDHQKKQNIKPYYWQVTFTKGQQASITLSAGQDFHDCTEGELCLTFGPGGRFIALENPSSFIPKEDINRKALTAVFSPSFDSLQKPLFSSLPDSLLNRLLYFNLNQPEASKLSYDNVKEDLLRGLPYQYSARDVRAMATYYLKQTGWGIKTLVPDTLISKNAGPVDAASIRYRFENPILGQQLALTMLISETGSLLSLKADYNAGQEEQNVHFIWSFAKQILIILFALAVVVIFFLRARSRVTDTQPAVVAAIIVGAVVVAHIVLWILGPLGLLSLPYTTEVNIVTLIVMGLYAGIASLLAFILFGAGDSIARQYWPQKIDCYDYIRRGMIFNKPVGTSLLQSVALAFVLAGGWTFILFLLPGLYFSPDLVFVAQSAAWPALRLFTHGVWYSFFVMLSIFLVIAALAYGYCKNRFLVAVPVVIAGGLVAAPLYNYGPFWLEFITSAILGLGLYAIFLKWDFLTALLSYFLFFCLIGSASGWIIPDSPDLVIFIWVIVALVVMAATGVFAVIYGEDEQKLASYVPEYVEEHANEERIKQELQIARSVQQTFLPKNTPSVSRLDIAATCIPAYETGGDYYDFIRLDDHRIAVTIGDVSGKGIQAAFYMTFIKGLLHGLGRKRYSPSEVLKEANRHFYDNAAKSTFISLIYGIIDLDKQTFTFARAGHNPILHLNGEGEKIDALRPNGLGIGLTNKKIFDNKINEIELNITGSDLFLLYTDGITEALNEVHQFYGTERLTNLLASNRNKSSSALISVITDEVKEFIATAKQHDDMTIMAIRFDELTNE